MRRLATVVDELSAFILDMDGVLYVGAKPIEGAAEAVERLRAMGKKLVFSTNNSAYTRRAYTRILRKMGIVAKESEIVTSAYVTSLYLRKHAPNARIFVIGELGLEQELKMAGFDLLPKDRAEEATHVVVGLDRGLTYEKLSLGLRSLLAGAELVATNTDSTYPTEVGLSPGAGAIVGALVCSSGKQPSVVVGKPSPHMMRVCLDVLGSRPRETAIVGDRLDTDIRAGKRLGLVTILVLTGATTRRDVERVKGTRTAPDFVISSIKDLVVGR
ncbi:MAG: HAD-IIA family hydrolase [Hadesarchaea archaeon]|nr:HAD-IIA family hydrolase [Hadesarchaea archaeon]